MSDDAREPRDRTPHHEADRSAEQDPAEAGGPGAGPDEAQEPASAPRATARRAEPGHLATGRAAVSGRLASLTAMSLVVGAIPVPVLPGRALRQVRGAVAHDVLARHGLSLVTDARLVLAEPHSRDRVRSLVRKAIEMGTRRLLRRLGPLAALSTVARAFEVYALGHLLERYLRRVRPAGTIRMQEAEARRVREAIDGAVFRVLSPTLEARSLTVAGPPEDLRDEFTRWIDTLLLTGATLPSYLQRRLEAAFDDVVRESPELGRV